MKDMNINQARLIQGLKSQGLNFKQDVLELSFEWESKLSQCAKQIHFKKPFNSYLSLGKALFLHLQNNRI